MVCRGLLELTDDLSVLDGTGFWAVVLPYEGSPLCARFAEVRPANPWTGALWPGCDRAAWRSTMDEAGFRRGVEAIRERIRAGDVYQVNLTRRLRAPLDLDLPGTDVAALGAALAEGNPAPYSAVVRIPEVGTAIASASPERFLRRDGEVVRSSPIKGTAATADGFLPKDRAENVMIVDLVRNDLGRVCRHGSVTVPALCAPEEHPGLVHLVSTVEGRLRPDAGWPELIEATFPPGSITGAPKISACKVIRDLEADARGPYCGGIGWVDADRRVGELNVAIRTFWMADDHLWFGTGGGITIDSTPVGEWAETELKAGRLLRVASQPAPEMGFA
jgi:para-aminobenzoate synthetase component 1